jgi:3-hydroxyisobutyrate dehydrogenase-like beta-hydroxyacid dehydrogenase
MTSGTRSSWGPDVVRLAFVGLGAIGLPMARRLGLHPDISMSIYDTRADVLAAEAALGRVATSVADAIADAEFILTVLPADAHVRSVAAEVAASAAEGQVFLDFSTISPRTIDGVAAELADAGVVTLGGALTRSVAAAETGDLSIFVGGAREHLERLRPALEQMASDIRMVDTAPAAKALKIVNNMVVSSLDVVICDVMLVAARHGVGPERFVDELSRRGADSWPLRNHIAKHLLTDELAPGRFSTRYMAKDAALASQLALDHGQPAWFAGLVTAAYRGTDGLGYGDHYHPIVMRWFEHAASAGRVTPDPAPGAPLSSAATETCDELCRVVAAQQALITLEALRLIAQEGVATEEALEHFESGSASNDCGRALRSGGPPEAAPDVAEMVHALTAGCRLAAEAGVPALTVEVARNLALALLATQGPSTFQALAIHA